MLVSSETGSGKTTQIPQFVFFDEYASGKMVACTQTRRIAATSVARRVASEMDVKLGEEVGYSVRFDNTTNDIITRLKYMTDGLLLREAMEDGTFSKYASDLPNTTRPVPYKQQQSCVIVDEAHERTLATDILMALLKQAVSRRPDLKVVIMSATLEVDKFQDYFRSTSLLKVAGRPFPVQIQYLSGATPHYLLDAIRVVKHIQRTMPSGDILLFLLSVSEIEQTCSILRETEEGLEVLPLYVSLSPAEQDQVFGKSSSRKCVVATNIAETSLTIDGIVYVVGKIFEQLEILYLRIWVTDS
jgi:pre-mRNA-splicing factor ATP-dependent RNA helicase DHX15/PRP43